MLKSLNHKQFIDHIRAQFGWKGMVAYAKKVRIAPGFLSEIISGKKKVSAATAKKLGFDIVTLYVPRKKQ